MSSDDFVVSGNEQPQRASGPLRSFGKAVLAVARLVLPVIALLIAFAAAYLYSHTHVTFLDGLIGGQGKNAPSTWLTWGHLLLPASFFAVQLAGRRYGANYAVAQVLITCCLIAGLDVAQAAYPDVPAIALPPAREAAAFAVAFFVALLVAAIVFELTRGTKWWTAPLFGSLWAALAFAAVFYPAAFAGSDVPWLDSATTHFGVMAAVGFALLIPYWIFRPLVRPLPGFGGY
jgi:uncharacterized PurR-regulated membrane protein YhhQ (DUF165 family)